MNSRNAKDSLLDAAERLVAERGLHGCSVREVVLASGQRNNSAVTYHFGGWDGLVEAVWRRRAEAVARQRDKLLTDVEPGSPDEIERLVDAYIRPFAAEVGSRAPSYWARFNEQLLLDMRTNFLAPTGIDRLDGSDPTPTHSAVVTLFARLAALLDDHLAPDARNRRVAVAVRFATTGLAGWERESEAGDAPEIALVVDELSSLTACLLRAP